LDNLYQPDFYNPIVFSVLTNNLQIYVNPADTLSYPGAGTTLFDISGNNRNFTLVGSPTFNTTYFTYDGTTQYASNGSAGINMTGCNSTIIAFIRRNGTQVNFASPIMSRDLVSSGFAYGPYFGISNVLSYVWRSYFGYNSGLTVNTNWTMVGLVTTLTQQTMYNNLSTATNTNTLVNPPSLLNQWDIGRDNFSPPTRYYKGDIGAVLVYNRTLSSAEMIYTYNTFKNLYGLP
jgi:hypothetical protein